MKKIDNLLPKTLISLANFFCAAPSFTYDCKWLPS
jgi:hypothetical protein